MSPATAAATVPLRRTSMRIPSGDGELDAWLALPDRAMTARPPVVVMGHGLGGVKDPDLARFAAFFTDAGIAALAFDYRGFGASPGHPRQLLDIDMQLTDWRSAVAWARGDARVDGRRPLLWGSSFAGGHVQVIAATDHRIGAVVAQVPFVDGRATIGDPRQAARLVAAGLRDKLRAARGRPPAYIGLAGHDGDLAAMTGPEVMGDSFARGRDAVGWENRVTPRGLLDMPRYRPGLLAGRIACPIRYYVVDDELTPPGPAVRAAGAAPLGEVAQFPTSHFAVYHEPWLTPVATDQAAFFTRALDLGPAVSAGAAR